LTGWSVGLPPINNMNLEFHHLGKAVSDIKKEYGFYQNFGFEREPGFEEPKIDKEQKVLVGAIRKGSLLIELLEPLGPGSPISNLKTGFYHICYKTDNLEKTITEIKEKSLARQITKPTTSVWENKTTVFFIDKNNIIFELL